MEDPHPGARMGEYVLDQWLGNGGFGMVWRAHHLVTAQIVAIKILAPDIFPESTLILREEVEILAAHALDGTPYIVKVLGGGTSPRPHIVMEFVEGADLASILRSEQSRTLPATRVIEISRDVARALAALHQAGIVHRDVKPANVLVSKDGPAKLTDFGIAKIMGYQTVTATGQLPMTMAYAAPEVWEGNVSPSSDIYALGVMMFQALVGETPFTGTFADLYRQHASKEPDLSRLPDDTPAALRELIGRCLQKREADRPADASECVRILDGLVQSDGNSPLVREPERFGPWKRIERSVPNGYAFLCEHQETGERSIVEVIFTDDLAYGDQLRLAVQENAALVPLGAERLLGWNRLLLHPGEAWDDPPAGQFQFWIAREGLAPKRPLSPLTPERVARIATSVAALLAAANAVDLRLRIDDGSCIVADNASIRVLRPGIDRIDAAQELDAAMKWLTALPRLADFESGEAEPPHLDIGQANVAKNNSDQASTAISQIGLDDLDESMVSQHESGNSRADSGGFEINFEPPSARTPVFEGASPAMAAASSLTSSIGLSVKLRAQGAGGTSTVYILDVCNHSEVPATIELAYDFDAPALRVAGPRLVSLGPEASATHLVRVNPRVTRETGQPREFEITVRASLDNGATWPTATTFEHRDLSLAGMVYPAVPMPRFVPPLLAGGVLIIAVLMALASLN